MCTSDTRRAGGDVDGGAAVVECAEAVGGVEGEPVALASVVAGGAAGDGVGLQDGAQQGALALAGHEADVLYDLPLRWREKLATLAG